MVMRKIGTIPTKEEVMGLKIGDQVMNCFGKYTEVTSITGGGTDVNGKAFICFYQRFAVDSTMSGSIKEDTPITTI